MTMIVLGYWALGILWALGLGHWSFNSDVTRQKHPRPRWPARPGDHPRSPVSFHTGRRRTHTGWHDDAMDLAAGVVRRRSVFCAERIFDHRHSPRCQGIGALLPQFLHAAGAADFSAVLRGAAGDLRDHSHLAADEFPGRSSADAESALVVAVHGQHSPGDEQRLAAESGLGESESFLVAGDRGAFLSGLA